MPVRQNKNLKPKCTAAGNTNACYLFYITTYASKLLSAFLHQSDYSNALFKKKCNLKMAEE